MSKLKQHIGPIIKAGKAYTLCGRPDSDNVIFNTGKKVTCNNCIKKKK